MTTTTTRRRCGDAAPLYNTYTDAHRYSEPERRERQDLLHVCICVCVCMRERERADDGKQSKQKALGGKKICKKQLGGVRVYEYVYVCE